MDIIDAAGEWQRLTERADVKDIFNRQVEFRRIVDGPHLNTVQIDDRSIRPVGDDGVMGGAHRDWTAGKLSCIPNEPLQLRASSQ